MAGGYDKKGPQAGHLPLAAPALLSASPTWRAHRQDPEQGT